MKINRKLIKKNKNNKKNKKNKRITLKNLRPEALQARRLAGWLAAWLAGWMPGLESALGYLKAVSFTFQLEFN